MATFADKLESSILSPALGLPSCTSVTSLSLLSRLGEHYEVFLSLIFRSTSKWISAFYLLVHHLKYQSEKALKLELGIWSLVSLASLTLIILGSRYYPVSGVR